MPNEHRHEDARSEIEEDDDAGKQGDQRCHARAAVQEFRAGCHRHQVGRDDKRRWDEQDVLGIAPEAATAASEPPAINETVRTDRMGTPLAASRPIQGGITSSRPSE